MVSLAARFTRVGRAMANKVSLQQTPAHDPRGPPGCFFQLIDPHGRRTGEGHIDTHTFAMGQRPDNGVQPLFDSDADGLGNEFFLFLGGWGDLLDEGEPFFWKFRGNDHEILLSINAT